jgi:hypothetical protein
MQRMTPEQKAVAAKSSQKYGGSVKGIGYTWPYLA